MIAWTSLGGVPNVGGISLASRMPEAAARAGADQKHAPALLQGDDDDFDAVRDALALLVHGRHDFAILVADEIDDVERRHRVDAERVGD